MTAALNLSNKQSKAPKAERSTMTKISRHDFTHDTIRSPFKTISYLEAGPSDGPLMIFVHGWPAVAATWRAQITTFAGLGFHVVAPDMPGYGGSTIKSKDKADYSMQSLVTAMVMLLKHLGRDEAVWVGHDWGAAVVWALLAHEPQTCTGVVNLCLPYRTLELGVDELLKYANRELYPEDEYPNAQWDYVKFCTDADGANFDKAVQFYESDIGNLMKALFRPHSPEGHGKRAFTSTVSKDGGWFGGAEKPPPTDLKDSLLDAEMLKELTEAFEKEDGGFWAPTAYYLNDDANKVWAEDWSVNEGVVSVPTLFVEASQDHVVGSYNSTIREPMESFCRRHTNVSIEAGHWVALERPEQTNAAIARWILTAIPRAWPYEKATPLKELKSEPTKVSTE
ncbi:hypothetical protein LTR47_010203 [Exophiala xenobiotica]|nr:hypothetical protein LTR47_010203 [Exophiala xenobiotica]KAK5251203.1 hypothetical protein LTS06_004161 [Exophiala xenobiotica]KAK5327785.1 hypothetical protein LTR93_003171 [Exophiala xenobiotica]KAK5361665.1 hypothetical protein LTS03_010288 [Exophiala xenobiotica]KAK5378638.1 hypothetical protein LTR11_004333 [Exophiala xenobiotica]